MTGNKKESDPPQEAGLVWILDPDREKNIIASVGINLFSERVPTYSERILRKLSNYLPYLQFIQNYRVQ